MMSSRQISTIGLLIALLGASGCAWERGGHGRDRDDNRREHSGQVPNSYQRDRDGRPCSGPGQGGDERHNQDCRPNGH